MNAYIEIIKRLVESIEPAAWHQQSYFPFKSITTPKSKLFDLCLFKSDAQGAIGFLWIEFENFSDLFLMPFELLRYDTDHSLISLPPWSLRHINESSSFYEAWRNAQNHKNPLITAYQGTFFHKKHDEESSFLATDIGSDRKKMRIRIDCQIVYKIFRTVERDHPQCLEVDFLQYLGNQNLFSHFAKLISVFEYSGRDILHSHSAICLRYIQNSGSLMPHFVALISHAQSIPSQELSNSKIWNQILILSESLGRLLGDFHTAMASAKLPNLLPEQTFGDLKTQWLDCMVENARSRIQSLCKSRSVGSTLHQIWPKLGPRLESLANRITSYQDLGLRIKTHGHLSLEQILISTDQTFFLLDYDSDDFEDTPLRRLKQSCLNDVVSLISSVRFCWFYNKKTGENRAHNCMLALQNMEAAFLKSYKSSLAENANGSYLLPKNMNVERDLFQFLLFICLLKETERRMIEKSPHVSVWFEILGDFLASEQTQYD